MNKMTVLKAATLAYLSQQASAAIRSDGLWTGHDWYDDAYELGVSNGVPYSNNPTVDRRIKAPLTTEGPTDDTYMSFPNVQLVSSLIDETAWTDNFPLRDPIYEYEDFLKAVAKFPAFCGETNIEGQSLEEACKRELAALFAHWGAETGKKEGSADTWWTQALNHVQEDRCLDG